MKSASRVLQLLLLLTPSLFAQGPYTLSGIVRQPEGFPATRATVTLTGSTGLNRQAFSDDMGRYEFSNLPRGRYSLNAVNPADADQYMDPYEVDLGRDMTTRVMAHLYLRLRTKVVEPVLKQSGTVSLNEQMLRAPKSAQKSFDEAMAFRGKRKFDRSLESFSKAIEGYPDYFQALSERGHLYIALNQPSRAARDFARALEIIPRYGPALRGAGLCEFQQGRYSEAIEYLRRAADAEPGNATNYLFLGAASLALDQREQARAALEKSLNIDPVGSARAHVHLANLSIKENRQGEAIQELKAYLQAQPGAPDAGKLRQVLAQLEAGSKP